MFKVKHVKKLISEVLGLPLYLFSMLSVRSNNIMVFGEWHGQNYCDNSKYLFEFMSLRNDGNKIIWITKNKKIQRIILDKGFKCEYYFSPKGMFYCLRARFAFVTHDSADINQFLLGRCTLVNLTHGTPLKRMGVDAKYLRLGRFTSVFDKYIDFFIPSKKKVDLIFCADDKAKERFQSSYPYSVEIIVSGYPRWQGLYANNSSLIDSVKQYDKVISYLPTLRLSNNVQLDPFSFGGFEDFCKYIESKNYLLIIRPHPVMKFVNENLVNNNIIFVRSADVRDVNEVLQVTDILISDYSSVIYDFEMTRKPILLLAPDVDSYLNEDVGVYGDYHKDFSWPIIDDWFAVMKCLDSTDFFLDDLSSETINASRKICDYIKTKQKI